MLLRTLGGLAFEGSNFSRPKPLLLLAYLALEGPQERRHLAELFWPQATDHLRSLTVALSQLRQSAPSIIRADDKQVEACVDSDAKAFLVQIEQSAWEEALELYQGPFLDGFYLKDWGEELEEWVYVTRERLAGHARAALMTLGEQAATQGEFDRARKHAEAAYRLRGSDLLEPAGLGRLHRLLLAGGSAYAAEVAREAKSFGVAVATSEVEARKELHDLQPKAPIRSNLPTPPTPFVGRRMELAELDRLLLDESNCRLLTLIGPGGIGKTRLALEAASAAVGGFAHGVFFASLAPVTSASGMPSAIAEALGFRFYSEALPKQQLLDYLREKQMLIVLDNFEHLLAATDFVTEILAAARGIKLLITSRESLHLQEEWRYPMEGLSFPRETSITAQGYPAPLAEPF